MRAMVMAAGLGTRLQPLTDHLPKPLMPVANRPVMEHLYRRIARSGFEAAVTNLHYHADAIREYFGDGTRIGMPIEWSYEDELLGTAGGTKRCEAFLRGGGDTFVVTSADGLHAVDLEALVRAHRESGAVATLTVKQTGYPERYGVAVTDERGFVTGFQEKPKPEEVLSNLVSIGIYCLHVSVLDRIPADTFYDFAKQVFPDLLEAGLPISVYETDAYWSDVGSADELLAANLAAVGGEIDLGLPEDPADLIDGSATVADGAEIEGRVLVGAGARIDAGARITGPAVVGPRASVAGGAALRSAVLLPGAVLAADELVAGGIIGRGEALEQAWEPAR